MSSDRNDPCLRAFLDAESEREAWISLDALLTGVAGAVTRDTVTRHLSRTRWMTDHIEDVLAELRVKLTEKLWFLRSGGVGEPIENFLAYSATASVRACYSFLRRQFPERTRLRNRIRYALTHHPETALESDAAGIWRCHSTATRTAPLVGNAQALLDSPRQYAIDHDINDRAPLPALVAEILATCDEPVEFDRFVDAVASILGVSDQPQASGADPLEQVADPAAPVTTQLEQRASVAEVWKEIAALPLRQRTALLLNLRDPDGGATLSSLSGTPVVTMTDIAAALEITEAELSDLWTDLPLDDLRIATRLGATRQQVINLRKSARARLARRLGRSRP